MLQHTNHTRTTLAALLALVENPEVSPVVAVAALIGGVGAIVDQGEDTALAEALHPFSAVAAEPLLTREQALNWWTKEAATIAEEHPLSSVFAELRHTVGMPQPGDQIDPCGTDGPALYADQDAAPAFEVQLGLVMNLPPGMTPEEAQNKFNKLVAPELRRALNDHYAPKRFWRGAADADTGSLTDGAPLNSEQGEAPAPVLEKNLKLHLLDLINNDPEIWQALGRAVSH